jgi:hypothetical protein
LGFAGPLQISLLFASNRGISISSRFRDGSDCACVF